MSKEMWESLNARAPGCKSLSHSPSLCEECVIVVAVAAVIVVVVLLILTPSLYPQTHLSA